MMDPERPRSRRRWRSAVRRASAGDDHRRPSGTAVAIARELGIVQSANQAVTGAELDQLSDQQLEARIQELGVYARVQPEHKVRIVNAWKKRARSPP